MNGSGTLFAFVDMWQHCARIYTMDGAAKCLSAAVIIGTPCTPGSIPGQLNSPRSACFVHHTGRETLLITDWGNHRVVEVTTSGVLLRTIAMAQGSAPHGIAYCGARDIIAVSLFSSHAVEFWQYDSCAVTPEVTIGSGIGSGNGQFCYPQGISFSADGRHLVVADCGNHRVSKFNAASGAFVAHLLTRNAHGILAPRDVFVCEDDSVIVTDHQVGCLVCTGDEVGATVHKIFATTFVRVSYSASLHAVVVKTFEGRMFQLRDAWSHSTRCAWLSAVTLG